VPNGGRAVALRGGRSRADGSRALGSAGDATQGTVGAPAPRGADRVDGALARAARRTRGTERGGGRSAGTAALLEWRLRRDVPAGSAFHLPQPGAPSGMGLELDEAQLQGDRRVPSLFLRATVLCWARGLRHLPVVVLCAWPRRLAARALGGGFCAAFRTVVLRSRGGCRGQAAGRCPARVRQRRLRGGTGVCGECEGCVGRPPRVAQSRVVQVLRRVGRLTGTRVLCVAQLRDGRGPRKRPDACR
jgi:hypothetical protein